MLRELDRNGRVIRDGGPLGAYSDSLLGNTSTYHPIRGVLLETEFIDIPAVDKLMNLNANHEAVKLNIINELGDALIDDIYQQPNP